MNPYLFSVLAFAGGLTVGMLAVVWRLRRSLEDTYRLDFIELTEQSVFKSPVYDWAVMEDGRLTCRGKTARAAIDAATAKSSEAA